MERSEAIALGLIIERPDIRDAIVDGVYGPHARTDAEGILRLDRNGRAWAAFDVAQSVEMDYDGQPPSQAAARLTAFNRGMTFGRRV